MNSDAKDCPETLQDQRQLILNNAKKSYGKTCNTYEDVKSTTCFKRKIEKKA